MSQEIHDARFDLVSRLTAQMTTMIGPRARLQPFLERVVRMLREVWPQIAQARLYLMQDDGHYRRAAGVDVPPGADSTLTPASAAGQALAQKKTVASVSSSRAVLLASGGEPFGALEIEFPPDATISPAFDETLSTLAFSLSLAIDYLRRAPLTRALALGPQIMAADSLRAMARLVADYVPEETEYVGLTHYEYDDGTPVWARTFALAGDLGAEPAEHVTTLDDHPFTAALDDLRRGDILAVPEEASWLSRDHFAWSNTTLVPLVIAGRLEGVVAVAGVALSPDELAGLRALANQISIALKNARQFQFTRQRITYEESLSEITSHLQEQSDLRLLLQQTMRDLGQVLGARRARVRLQVTPSEASSPEEGE